MVGLEVAEGAVGSGFLGYFGLKFLGVCCYLEFYLGL